MRHVADFPHQVRAIESATIVLGDGCRLRARIWLPTAAEEKPVPAILEYLPYRKNDATAGRDAQIHPYFAGHGYASLRVDMRGSGDSDGILVDEYLKQEQDDALEVLAWIASQPWCSGEVGIIGKSWGGFNGLQIAARRPPELKAVISVASTDDRYADDVHYIGGCLFGDSMLSWASAMLAYNARPPDPKYVGAEWREMWFRRLEETPPFLDAWVSHQRRDAFWKHGSISDDFAAVKCPVYAVGGWTDGYTSAVLRILNGLDGPRKGLIGPWGHLYPQDGVPGPAIGFLQECLRWWDYWLKGLETGVMDEPMLRVWMQDPVAPTTYVEHRPGRWVTEPTWPSPDVGRTRLTLNDRSLDEEPGDVAELEIRGSQVTGLSCGAWSAWGKPADLPPDQRSDDGRSLCFDSKPLVEPLEILGFPELRVAVAADQPCALLAARLCDVAPGGASSLITRGFLNLTHRDSHEFPKPLEPGQTYTVEFPLKAIGQVVPAGHRLRLAISPTYWPYTWPSPDAATLTVKLGGPSWIELPTCANRAGAAETPADFGPPEAAQPLDAIVLGQGAGDRKLVHDVATGTYELSIDLDVFGSRQLADGLTYTERGQDVFTIREDEPLSAMGRSTWNISVGRDEWQTRIETQSSLSADRDAFHLTNALSAYEGNVRVFTKSWTREIRGTWFDARTGMLLQSGRVPVCLLSAGSRHDDRRRSTTEPRFLQSHGSSSQWHARPLLSRFQVVMSRRG